MNPPLSFAGFNRKERIGRKEKTRTPGAPPRRAATQASQTLKEILADRHPELMEAE
jgi:hypothetical protein